MRTRGKGSVHGATKKRLRELLTAENPGDRQVGYALLEGRLKAKRPVWEIMTDPEVLRTWRLDEHGAEGPQREAACKLRRLLRDVAADAPAVANKLN